MAEFFAVASALAAGLLLGVFFFGGLWWTVVRGAASQQPAVWFFGSLVLRMSITLVGFYFVGRDHLGRWLACLLGFVLARLIVTRLTRRPPGQRRPPAPESSCAS